MSKVSHTKRDETLRKKLSFEATKWNHVNNLISNYDKLYKLEMINNGHTFKVQFKDKNLAMDQLPQVIT